MKMGTPGESLSSADIVTNVSKTVILRKSMREHILETHLSSADIVTNASVDQPP
jgi:hypothetical protein